MKPGEWVEGITGVVITSRPGISKVLSPMMLGDNPSVRVSPGEVLYTLHYMGEGYDLFWFRGRTYSDQIAGDKPDPDPPPQDLKIQIVSRPQYVWWAKIKNGKGQIGWTDQTHRFTHVDRFAFRLPSPHTMKKKVSRHNRRNEQDTMRPEYDFSAAVRGLTAARYAQGANIAVIDPKVLDVFPDSTTVNQTLRALPPVLRRQRRRASKGRNAR